jgi:hypothetical protein
VVSGLERAAADECLTEVFGDAYGQLTVDQASLLIDDLLELAAREPVRDLYEAARTLRWRIHPAPLASYAATLQAGRP